MKYIIIALLTVLVSIAFPLPSEGQYYNNYGDMDGDTMTFQDVTELNLKVPYALYGTPYTIGDTLHFNPIMFAQRVEDGESGILDGTLSTTIEAGDGTYIGAVRFAEYGDVSLSGTGGADTYASIANTITLKVTELDGIPANVPTLHVSTLFSPSGGDWDLAEDGVQASTQWQGVLYADLDAWIETCELPGHATKVELTMDNVLNNGSEDGTESEIHKKATDGIGITPMEEIPIPEPTVLALLGVGGLVLALMRGKRKS